MTLSKIPNLWKRLSIKSVVILSKVTSFVIGINIIPFIRPLSTIDKIESYPLNLERFVIRSIAIGTKGQLNYGTGIF